MPVVRGHRSGSGRAHGKRETRERLQAGSQERQAEHGARCGKELCGAERGERLPIHALCLDSGVPDAFAEGMRLVPGHGASQGDLA